MIVQNCGKLALRLAHFCGTRLPVRKPYTLGFCHSPIKGEENLSGFLSRDAGGVENKRPRPDGNPNEAHHATAGGSHG